MKNPYVRRICRGALLLAICVGIQFLKNTSVFITGPVVNAVLIIAVLACGYPEAAAISILTPLTSWWITGSPVMSAFPAIVPCVMAGNLLLVSVVWLLARWLTARMPKAERLYFHDPRFRQVLIVALIACALWASACLAFLTSLSSALLLEKSTPLTVVMLVSVSGAFVLFACLWMLVSRFPDTWSLIAGMVLGSVVKALFMWLVISRLILSEAAASKLPEAALSAARANFSIVQLLTALIGSALAFLIWLPLKKALRKGA